MTQATPTPAGSAPATTEPARRRWLLFVHQLPSHPSNLRVTTWRRLQQLGAVPLKQAVYALPDTATTREDFEWLRTEVQAAGGDASVFSADNVDPWSDDALVEDFRRSRQEAYAALARDAEQALKRTSSRRGRAIRAPAVGRLLGTFRERLSAIEAIDFFGSAGRDRVIAVLEQIEGRRADPKRAKDAAADPGSRDGVAYRGRLWITRPRPGVDRMASAWLIRRFIDSEARFAFAAEKQRVREDGIPFDMFGVEFSHQGGGCTFETLCSIFALDEPALSRIAGIVHDLDLKDERFGAAECGTVGAMIEGLQLAYHDDDQLLAQGITLFDSLYRSFGQAARSTGPRQVARPKAEHRRPASSRRRSKSR